MSTRQNDEILESLYEEGLAAGMTEDVAQTYAQEQFEAMEEAV